MPRIAVYDIDAYDDMDDATFEPIRRSTDPVNGHHDLQRRTENMKNRLIKQARDFKERVR